MLTKACAVFGLLSITLCAETGRDAWLRYAPVTDGREQYHSTVPAVVVALHHSAILDNAQNEIVRGVRGMLERTLRTESHVPAESAIVVGTVADIRRDLPNASVPANLKPDAFALRTVAHNEKTYTIITAVNDRGVLYGAFAYLRRISTGQSVAKLDDTQTPYVPIRWINQWDNLNGTIERGYGGHSIFWENKKARADLSRAYEYGRLLASLGINGCSLTNVNSDPLILSPAFLPEIARVAEALRPWGVQIVLSVDFGSPQSLGGLKTFDPLDQKVAEWWKEKEDALYKAVPDMAGFVLKADSEGRVGPSAYGRTHADAANVVARGLKPHGGVLFYRGFVYDHHMDWRNPKNDRARAAYDNFFPLDGKFDDNVIIQIKNGPVDFQVREPVSPLFGALEKTNEGIELQITQEYFGQARHTVFLVPQWKDTLDFDLHAKGPGTPVKALIAGKVFHQPLGGFVGVANVGLDENWTGNELSQANLYGFGRLAWDPNLTSTQIADEWTRMTFGTDPRVLETIRSIQLTSWRTYEDYTGPLGLQTLTDIVGNHYGPAVEASERNGWGQWHRADEHGVGMDRTTATGTGYIGQYRPAVASAYENLKTCPDELLLFMHHVPYTYVLHDGKTVIQYIYDSHYEGAAAVARYAVQWKALKGLVDDQRYREVLSQLEYQAGSAQVWRDAINDWFHRESGIADKGGRVGRHPGRYEAEAMNLDGYSVVGVTPWEDASGGKAVECHAPRCAATMKFNGQPGWYALRVQYFDQNDGVSHYLLNISGQPIGSWFAADHFPIRKTDGSSSTRKIACGVALRPGDEIRIEGVPDGGEPAALDYIEILPGTGDFPECIVPERHSRSTVTASR